jgi:hypothetical protein
LIPTDSPVRVRPPQPRSRSRRRRFRAWKRPTIPSDPGRVGNLPSRHAVVWTGSPCRWALLADKHECERRESGRLLAPPAPHIAARYVSPTCPPLSWARKPDRR